MVVMLGRSRFFRSVLASSMLVGLTPDPGWSAPLPRAPSLCDIPHPSDALVEWDCRRIRKGESLENLFGRRWVDVARFNRVDRRHVYPGVSVKVPRRLEAITDFTPMPAEYPPAKEDEKFLLVDLSEQFLGAYERGRLVFSAPIATGEAGKETPAGIFRITAAHREHRSTLYFIEGTDIPYPMTYALRFHINREGVSFWIHGRDLSGVPSSHGCIGLYDEAMQRRYYGTPGEPVLEDARNLYEWVIASRQDTGKVLVFSDGPRMLVKGRAPKTRAGLAPPGSSSSTRSDAWPSRKLAR